MNSTEVITFYLLLQKNDNRILYHWISLQDMTYFDIVMGAHLKHIVAHILIAVTAYGVTNLI